MLKDATVEMLREKTGLNIDRKEVQKGGVMKSALIVMIREELGLTIYESNFNDCTSDEDVLERFNNMVNSHDKITNNDIKQLRECINADNIKDNCFVSLLPRVNDDIKSHCYVKEFMDLVAIVRFNISGGVANLPRNNDLYSEEDVWMWAESNTDKNVIMLDLNELLINAGEDIDSQPSMIAISNSNKFYGAGAIFSETTRKKIKMFCDNKGIDEAVIIPSSIHEVIILNKENVDLEDINGIINSVNSQDIAEEDILSNHAYVYNVKEDKIYMKEM